MARLPWALALFALFLVTLLANAPARLLAHVLPGEQVILQGLDGTVWNGSASRCMIELPVGFLHLGSVRWSLDPWSLLTLAPRLELQSNWGRQTAAGSLRLRGSQDLLVEDFEGRVGADLLRRFAPLAVGGSFEVQLAVLELREGLPHRAKGRLVWQQASWLSPRGPVPLGSYALDVEQPAGEALVGEVVTLQGPLEARGGVRLEGRRYALDVFAGGDAALNDDLNNALALLAAPEPDGYRIALEGEF